MKHYYTNNENLESAPEKFVYHYQGKELTFISDIGVFSKKMIDYGSRVLLDTIYIDSSKKSLLDVGCGYGTFGVALKSVYPFLRVEMVDVNERAINLAKKNLQNNNLDAKVYMSSVYENVIGKYDVIVTNPPIRAGKEIVTRILVEAQEHLNYGGEIWVVIQKKQGAPSAKKNLEKIFENVTIENKDKGYYVFKAVNHISVD